MTEIRLDTLCYPCQVHPCTRYPARVGAWRPTVVNSPAAPRLRRPSRCSPRCARHSMFRSGLGLLPLLAAQGPQRGPRRGRRTDGAAQRARSGAPLPALVATAEHRGPHPSRPGTAGVIGLRPARAERRRRAGSVLRAGRLRPPASWRDRARTPGRRCARNG